ncbi:unnamed protein product [Clonostachys rhizophaga]|uniref:Uncharacterized protein n=1 Tax=Clonostachys rhizophaga TaxID=160324 RepID=A0A9N9VQW2_9HYPO|nr:unnamed protein product [Clonostachys rhizophaga]
MQTFILAIEKQLTLPGPLTEHCTIDRCNHCKNGVQPNSELVNLRQELKDIRARYRALLAEIQQFKEEHEDLYVYLTKSVHNIHTLQTQAIYQNTVNDMLLEELAAIRETCSPEVNLPECYERVSGATANINAQLPPPPSQFCKHGGKDV